jgi:hypothetical protein
MQAPARGVDASFPMIASRKCVAGLNRTKHSPSCDLQPACRSMPYQTWRCGLMREGQDV